MSSKNKPKIKKTIEAADGLSLGISMVVAVLIGIGLGIGMERLFGYRWLFWLGVFWGVAAAILNIYKAYKKQKKELDELANDPKYARRKYDASDDGDDFGGNY